MSLKQGIRLVAWPVAISLAALIAAGILDIVLSSLWLRFSSQGLTITCFAVSGIFSGLFCYNAALDQIATEERDRIAMRTVMIMTALCVLLFFVVAPMSGREYDIPFRIFAVAEEFMVLFLWKNKFHQDA